MHALVTGCAGFIGSHLTQSLLEDGHTVVGIDCFNDNYGRAQKLRNLKDVGDWEGFEFVPVDLARGDLQELTERSDVVFHLAAEPGVRSSWGTRYRQYLENNILATQHLLDALREKPATRLVYASSSSVYGNADVRPTPEEAPTRPLSPYGQTKLAAEHLCHLYGAEYGVDTASLRYFTVFGPRQRPDMAFHIFCRAVLERRPIQVFGDGGQTRDFSYVGDVVAATRRAATADLKGERVFNIGGGSPTSLTNTIDLLRDISGREVVVEHVDRERGDARDTAADTSRARDILGFRPSTPLAEGLRAEFEWVAEMLSPSGVA